MSMVPAEINYDLYNKESSYEDLEQAVNAILLNTNQQFDEIKKEKWYNRLFNCIIFSHVENKRLASQVSSLAQAQSILLYMLSYLSERDVLVNKLVKNNMQNIVALSETDKSLAKSIKRLENYVVFGITKSSDIRNLSDNNKRILKDCLSRIGEYYGDTTDEQQQYADNVLRFIGDREHNDKIENIDKALESVDETNRYIMLSCCLEYIYLYGDDFNYNNNDDINDLLDEFNIGNKSIKEITNKIKNTVRLRGVYGLINKYSKSNFEELDDIFTVDFNEDENEDIKKNEENEENEENIEIIDETISSILLIRVGETKVYKNKHLHISTFINCEGTLMLDHCVIDYNETSERNEISIAKGANLSILNSRIICKGYNKNFFISCQGENRVNIESTTFTDCSNFIKSNDDINFTMTKCELKDCFDGFISIRSNEDSICEISNNKILQESISKFNFDNKQSKSELINIRRWGNKGVIFSNNTITEKLSFKTSLNPSKKNTTLDDIEDVAEVYEGLDVLFDFFKHKDKFVYICCSNFDVTNCLFDGISSPIEISNIQNSTFKNCSNALQIIDNTSYGEYKKIVDTCIFENCTNVINADFNTLIKNCEFISCYNQIITGAMNGGLDIEFCKFLKIKNDEPFLYENACITFQRTKHDSSRTNHLTKCIFDGVDIESDNYLIAAYTINEKPYETVAWIENCDFRNYVTKNSSNKIIKEYIKYEAWGKEKPYLAIMISDCTGL